jgi:hypothetical protein
MSAHSAVEKLSISDDRYILDYFSNERVNKEMTFIRNSTRTQLKKLRDVELPLQDENLMLTLWKSLVDDAIIFLKRRDTREKYHDDRTLGTDEMLAFLREFQRFEPILFGAVPNYRDHVAHAFRVFVLGQSIIKKAIGFENLKLKEDLFEISPQEKEAMWCLCSLTHDLGYSLEVIHHINQRVRSMLQKFGNIPVQELEYSYFAQFGNISEFAVKFLSSDITKLNKDSFSTHLQAKYYIKFLSALGNFNHGVISSIILMKDLVYFKESDYALDHFKPLKNEDARQFMIRREILRAIASHSCDDIYYLGIKNFPFLMTVCDEMQEWGRPRLVDITKRGGSKTELTINKFDGKIVDYKVSFSPVAGLHPSEGEKHYMQEEVATYFRKKTNKWLNLLRSAVGGKERDLKLNFTVEDKISSTTKTYSIKHVNPKEITIEPRRFNLTEEPSY